MRHEYEAKVEWQRGRTGLFEEQIQPRPYLDFRRRNRRAGVCITQVIPPPLSVKKQSIGERLWSRRYPVATCCGFLALAGKKKLVVESYQDNAVGILEKNSDGKTAITEVILKPNIVFGGDEVPAKELLDELHEQAHDLCFIANSLKSEVRVEPAS